MAFAQASNRPIPGAVATAGISDRIAFLRKTYAHLGIALVVWAAITMGMMKFATATSFKFGMWALGVPNGSRWNWIMILVAFMGVGYLAERMAKSETSRGIQYGGLAVAVVAEAILLQPLLWVLAIKFGARDVIDSGAGGSLVLSAKASSILGQAAILTALIFGGLTAVVFVTKKDFSFMRGALMIASFGFMGLILASAIFGFQMGTLFAMFGILLMAGYVLYQTSAVMKSFPPTHHVAAALMLFSTVATLFWYVLQLLMRLNSRD
jgi:uncharacterized protein